jgi:hypothetical protein
MVKAYEANATVNRLMSWMARRGLGRTEVLTTTGRKSGQTRQVPVSPIDIEGAEYLVAPTVQSPGSKTRGTTPT